MTTPRPSRFLKMNGLGNEILVVDLRGTRLLVLAEGVRRAAEAPHTHFDQMMVLHDPKTAGTAAYVRIYNTDGSEAEACGNGTRCVADYLAAAFVDGELRLETRPGLLTVRKAGDHVYTVDMGKPRFAWNEIPLVEPFHDTRRIELQVGPIDAPLIHSPSVVNVGNPHCIFWVERLDIVDLGKVGPMLEHHRLFPERANISLARIVSPERIELQVWERGVGLTRACGSAACAATVAAVRKNLTGRRVTVALPGGELEIEWRADDRILMTGPVELEYEGELPDGVLTEPAR
jgi:diaminopimelate epimerase